MDLLARNSDPVINGDLSRYVCVETNEMEWAPSPSGTVFRKRVHLVGPPESGQVTSVVRYEPGSRFPAHGHPAGEEILVLKGTFSDEHGDWPRGAYLLNPEGFHHAPYSQGGCVLLVKLRQYPGTDRMHVSLDTETLPWVSDARPGVTSKPLYAQPGFGDTVRLERWEAGASPGPRSYPGGAELFVIDGGFTDEHGSHGPGTWCRFPAGSRHLARTDGGCRIYLKEGGLAYLHAGAS